MILKQLDPSASPHGLLTRSPFKEATGLIVDYSLVSKISKVGFQGSRRENSKLEGFSDSAHCMQFLPY